MLNVKGIIIRLINSLWSILSHIDCLYRPDCQIMCPEKACEMEDCPKCVTVCKSPHCVTHCQVIKSIILFETIQLQINIFNS